ncbi:hypothetical protein RBU49_00585 [Clostridium sp. MB40-C1]|uniref:hypothetical protein n=1 Tax=Clostridium sp. MB40-C1 TaxID=3070996 RepID=UPI0027DEB31A|nr:hypothetical protein [Clostridium sp. MB40-C1]WMJ80773.1 hypothetical protein RBU49_00585 [Clostridium sp. MB40-C1]
MRKFFKKLIFLLPILVILVCTNYFIDPGNIFYKHGLYEKGIAELLSTDKNVENLTNYDERLLQKFYVDKISDPKNLVVLGSSRSMQINSDILKEKNMFNSSVSGASLEDIMAVYGIYREKEHIPKKVMIGLDPWILNKNNNQNRWKSINSSYFYIQNQIGIEDKTNKKLDEKYLELVSLAYFQSAIETISKGNSITYSPTERNYSKTNMKRSDGSLVYNEEIRNRTVKESRKLSTNYVSEKPIYCLGNFDKIDDSYKNQFEKFINLMQQDGVQIEFFLSPYHPYVYKKLMDSSEYRIVDKVEKYFIQFAKSKGITVYGSYDPVTIGCTEDDFYDGMHIKTSGVKKIFNN